MDEKTPYIPQAARLLAIVSQLYTTRISALLSEHGFTLAQFALLNHLAESPASHHTISDLTASMETNQPGITKIVRKFSEEGLVNVAVDPVDSRKKQIAITEAGREKIVSVGLAMNPDVSAWFADWSVPEITQLMQNLGRLASWFDNNRLD